MPKDWSDKRERQHQHIKDSLQARGKKERAEHGEARQATLNDTPAPVRGDRNAAKLAARRPNCGRKPDAPGRSKIDKAELGKALARE